MGSLFFPWRENQRREPKTGYFKKIWFGPCNIVFGFSMWKSNKSPMTKKKSGLDLSQSNDTYPNSHPHTITDHSSSEVITQKKKKKWTFSRVYYDKFEFLVLIIFSGKCRLWELQKGFWKSPSSGFTSPFRSFLCTLSPTIPKISRNSWET